MVEIKFYETVGARKKNEALGVFNVRIVPEEVAPVDETLKGEKLEKALVKRSIAVKQARKACEDAALDKIRDLIGGTGILVAKIIEEEEV